MAALRPFARRLKAALVLTLALVLAGPPVPAQLTPEQLRAAIGRDAETRALEELLGDRAPGALPRDELSPERRVFDPLPAGAGGRREPSPLERGYSDRAGRPLRLFGLDVFGRPRAAVVTQTGAAPETYRIGIGDEIVLALRGQTSRTVRARVDREGRLVIADLPPVAAAGRSFAELRADLEIAVEQAFTGTQVFISLGEVRQVSVLVAGEVERPGPVTLTALSSVPDALLLAGGIQPLGSLRNLRLFREGTETPLDLYGLLTVEDGASAIRLAEGDRIVVPPIGNTVAVAGSVKRPAIYELAPNRDEISAAELLDLAGGTETRGRWRYSVLRIERDGRELLTEIREPAAHLLRDGEILIVDPAVDVTTGVITLAGHVRLPGRYAAATTPGVRSLLAGGDRLRVEPYLPLAVLARIDPATRSVAYSGFDLGAVLNGEDVALRGDDTVYVLGLEDVAFLSSRSVVEALGSAREAIQRQRDRAARMDEADRRRLRDRDDERESDGDDEDGRRRETEDGDRGDERDRSAAERRLSAERRPAVPPPLPADREPGSYNTGEIARLLALRDDEVARLPGAQDLGLERVEPEIRDRSCAGTELLERLVRADPSGELASGQISQSAELLVPIPLPCPDLFQAVPELVPFLVQNAILVTGSVTRPGIYPVTNPSQSEAVLAIAGGRDLAGVEILGAGRRFATSRSEILEFSEARVRLAGHIKFPGSRLLSTAPALSDLIGDPDLFRERPYLLFGILSRRNPETLFRQAVPFSPQQVLAGGTDLPLLDRDIVRILGVDELRRLLDKAGLSRATARPQGRRDLGGTAGELRRRERNIDDRVRYVDAEQKFASRERDRRDPLADADLDEVDLATLDEGDVLVELIRDYLIQIDGEVAQPGAYPILPNTPLSAALAAAGGPTGRADLSTVEVTLARYNTTLGVIETTRQTFDLRQGGAERISLAPGDSLRLRPVFSQVANASVTLEGEVRFPGVYPIVRGERLSSVLDRAGGLTDEAYPEGAVFTRLSAAVAEAQGNRRLAQDLERSVLTLVTAPRPEESVDASAAEFVLGLAERLREAPTVGRIPVEVDPNRLAVRPDQDTLLEGGDRLFVPSRPNFVIVSGEVLNPSTVGYRAGWQVDDYILAAGGMTQDADDGRTFVILPDGTAEQAEISPWSYGARGIPPGSTVVVPRDLRPFSFRQFAIDVSQIVSQLAVTAASIAVIGSNN